MSNSTKTSRKGLQALVFGASGITGWAITNSALSYQTLSTFSRVKIEIVEQITHVYFAAYVHRGWGGEGSEERIKENVDFLINAIAAVEAVCPNLQFWTFPTGGKVVTHSNPWFRGIELAWIKWYGFEFGKKVERITLSKESATVYLPVMMSTYSTTLKSTPYPSSPKARARIRRYTPGCHYTVGFVPNHNPMNLAEPIALYFAFNIADVDNGLSFEMVWPGIEAYFGLEGVGPVEGEEVSCEKWVLGKKGEWDEWTRKNWLREKVLQKTCWDFMTVVAGEYSTFDRDFDLGEARRIGFTESVDHVKGYHIAFDRMRAAKIIP
ncbi:hypothetical protein L207DRAFT_587088 [Hyaloscypha variabilis F]|uniref:PRISE-like Rossmann-fold domain-containing protein n=1 Tax=Hyaloscypha variabilis (strain UAMH 11265 / GT02V1 / F) TaxID=1149755 RepID=A0A2J6RC38_HYAVF|nr:hypothetical protein L207DRAFT_587088 [Hyaloscypha variabilis F]